MNLLTASETADFLRVSVARAYELARLGILEPVKIGRQVRFSEDRLREWIGSGGRTLAGGWRREAQ